MKRFYENATCEPRGAGVGIALDGRALTTPAGTALAVPTRALAEAIAAEWRAQDGTVEPSTMPLTRMANTALDRVPDRRRSLEAGLRACAETDLLCYRVDGPAELARRQARLWRPLDAWLLERHGVALRATRALGPVEQPEETLVRLGRVLAALDDFELVAVDAVAAVTRSVVLALALRDGAIDARSAFEAAFVDELHGLEVWGDDREARRRLDSLDSELRAAERLLLALREPPAALAASRGRR